MPADEQTLGEFLSGRHIATVATEKEDGSIHLAAMWYLYEDGSLYIPTSSSTQKARNLERRPRAAVMVDSRGSTPYRGGATHGPVEILSGERAAEIRERVLRRYLSEEGAASPSMGGLIRASDDIVIRVRCGRWTWWDVGALFGADWNERFVLPLDG